MKNRSSLWRVTLAVPVLWYAGTAWGQAMGGNADKPVGHTVTSAKFERVPGLPECTRGAVMSGDPGKGPAIILARAAAGCTVPWHWHTPNEHLMMTKGSARVEVKDGKTIVLRSGGYAMLPTKHVHRFTCTTECAFFVHSDAAFDIHYVKDNGDEIAAEEALKSPNGASRKKKA